MINTALDILKEEEILYESRRTKVFKAVGPDGNIMVVKALNKPNPTSEDIDNYTREYNIAKKIEGTEGIQSYQLIIDADKICLVSGGFVGYSLDEYLKANQPDISQSLLIALKISGILANIHNNNVIHKDLNPSNIVYNPENNQLSIIDFGNACVLSNNENGTVNFNQFDGTLDYMSPEQTGRVDIPVDYRTDLYSLGATMYRMFTGQLPFEGDDAMELVHSHIARLPENPVKLNPKIPAPVSKIITKLLSKNPEERYHTASGLAIDLEKCHKQYTETGRIEDFVPGQDDFSTRFHFAHKLYGHKGETEILNKALLRASNGGNELIMIKGNAGMGKTYLVNHFQQEVLSSNGLFYSGQFEHQKKDIPLNGVLHAINKLLVQLLSNKPEQILQWKNDIQQALGPNGKLFTNLLPELEKIIGPQEDIPQLNPAETQNRFTMVFRNFLSVFAREQKPLVLFLDNLQWSDNLSLQIINDLTINRLPNLMLVCAIREKDAHKEPLVDISFDEIKKYRNVIEIELENLSKNAISEMLEDTFKGANNNMPELVDIVIHKTGGNPYFIKELLLKLYRQKHIWVSPKAKDWEWDIEAIKKSNIPDDIFSIIKERIKNIPEASVKALKTAACIGYVFDLDTLSKIMEVPSGKVAVWLIPALEEGVLYAQGQATYNSDNLSVNVANITYRFQHLRVQQVVHSLLNDDELAQLHFLVGKFLLRSLSQDEKQHRIIEIVDHLNYGISYMEGDEEKDFYAGLNLQAGEKAVSASAYGTAISFFEKATFLLPDDHWKRCYNLSFKLYTGYAESAYQTGRYKEAEKIIDNGLQNITSRLDKAYVISMRLRHYATVGKTKEALVEGQKALALLGVKIKLDPGTPMLMKEIVKARFLQGRKKISQLIDMPLMRSAEMKMIARIYTEMGAPAYTLGKNILYGILALKVVNLGLKHGYMHELPYALVAYGMLKAEGFGNYSDGNELGAIAIKLSEKQNNIEYMCRVIAAYGVLTHHWNNHWSSLTHWYKKGVEAGIHSGDIFYLAHCASNCVAWDPRLNLGTQIREHKKYMQIIRSTGFDDAIDTAEIRLQVMLNMQAKTNSMTSLSNSLFNEDERLEKIKQRNYVSGIAMYHIAKAEIYLLYGNFKESFNHVTESDKYVQSLAGLNYNFLLSVVAFHASSQLLSSGTVSAREEKTYRKRMMGEYRKMKKWAGHNPKNYVHQLLIMEAELERHRNAFHKASTLYEKAINTAAANRWFKDEAFFHELTALFFQSQKLDKAATGYIKQAYHLYSRHGVTAKVQQLRANYPNVIEELPTGIIDSIRRKSTGTTVPSTIGGNTGVFDILTIAKSSQAISGEIHLETLLKKLMQITVENAGAQRGVLLLKLQQNMQVQAAYNIVNNQMKVLQSEHLHDYTDIPQTVINFVVNTQKTVVLGDACLQGDFTDDPYITAQKPKSILAEPIVKLGKLNGILYLENNLNHNVFSIKRQQVIRILSSQIAISIENSRIFEDLEEKIKERTQDLEAINNELSEKNSQITQQKHELERINASKDKMFSIIAHDLKSPFSSILSLTQMFASNMMDLDKDEMVNLSSEIYKTATKVHALLENLLNWAMAQTGKMRLNPERFMLSEITSEVVNLLSNNAATKSIQLLCDFDQSIVLYADRHMVYTILRNLVGNAIKFSFSKSSVRIKAVQENGETTLSVHDTGMGIDPDRLKNLFQLTDLPSNAGTNNETGTGLGLLLCKDFVDMHKGKIWVESLPGKGSTFYFSVSNKEMPASH